MRRLHGGDRSVFQNPCSQSDHREVEQVVGDDHVRSVGQFATGRRHLARRQFKVDSADKRQGWTQSMRARYILTD